MPDTDSEAEGALGSVSKLVVRPPGHSGKAKRGHLCFDASYETGNLGRVDYIAEHEYDLFVRPDTCNPRFRFSFNFSVDNIKAGQFSIFNVVNFHKSKTLFSQGLTPLVRSTSRPRWIRLPKDSVYYFLSPDHGGHHVLSFSFSFDVEEDAYQFALTYPYSYSRMQSYLNLLESRKLPFCRRMNLANSIMKRRCDVLTITSPSNMTPTVLEGGMGVHPGEEQGNEGGGETEKQQEKRIGKTAFEVLGKVPRGIIGVAGTPEEERRTPTPTGASSSTPLNPEEVVEKLVKHQKTAESDRESVSSVSDSCISNIPTNPNLKRAVVIMARVNAGDSPTSYIVQGMIEQLLSLGAIGHTLREKVIFKVIPMMNPDGVFLGNYRSNLLGSSLDRMWGTASPWGHPTLHATRSLILHLDRAEWCELDLVLDLQSHHSMVGTFLYGTAYEDVYRHERHIVFPKILSYTCEDYNPDNTIYNKDPALAQSSRRWLSTALSDAVNSYTLYTSVHAYKNRKGQMTPYTEDSYFRVGRNLVRAVLDYYQFLGIIPHEIPDALPLHDLPKRYPDVPNYDTHTGARKKGRSRQSSCKLSGRFTKSSSVDHQTISEGSQSCPEYGEEKDLNFFGEDDRLSLRSLNSDIEDSSIDDSHSLSSSQDNLEEDDNFLVEIKPTKKIKRRQKSSAKSSGKAGKSLSNRSSTKQNGELDLQLRRRVQPGYRDFSLDLSEAGDGRPAFPGLPAFKAKAFKYQENTTEPTIKSNKRKVTDKEKFSIRYYDWRRVTKLRKRIKKKKSKLRSSSPMKKKSKSLTSKKFKTIASSFGHFPTHDKYSKSLKKTSVKRISEPKDDSSVGPEFKTLCTSEKNSLQILQLKMKLENKNAKPKQPTSLLQHFLDPKRKL